MPQIIIIIINGTQYICSAENITKKDLETLKKYSKNPIFKTNLAMNDDAIFNQFIKEISTKFNIQLKKILITDIIRI